jgi:hypothetical protein
MIIGFFKSNQPSSIVITLLIAILLWFPGFLHPQIVSEENKMPLFELLFNWTANYNLISVITAFVLLMVEAFLLNYVLNEHEVTHKRSFIPALVFVILMSNGRELQLLHGPLIANLFIILALNKLLSFYKKENSFSEIFDAGFLIAVASLFQATSAFFFILVYVALIIFHSFIWREWVIAAIGFILPYLFTASILYLFDLSYKNYAGNILYSEDAKTIPYSMNAFFVSLYIISTILFLSLFSWLVNNKGLKLKTTKSTTLLVYYFIIIPIVYFIFRPAPYYLSYIALPLSMLFTNYFILVRKKWWAEITFLILLFSVIANVYNLF